MEGAVGTTGVDLDPALLAAAGKHNRQVVAWLLRARAEPRLQNTRGAGALVLAAEKGLRGTWKILEIMLIFCLLQS